MNWPNQNDIPKSIIKGSGVVHADLSLLKGRGKLLQVNTVSSLIALDDVPYILIASSTFNAEKLIQETGRNIYDVKRLSVQCTFDVNPKFKDDYCAIPKWINDFDKIEELRFGNVIVDDLHTLNGLPIERLIFSNIQFNNGDKLGGDISLFKKLKYVFYDDLFPVEAIELLKRQNPTLVISSIENYQFDL